jgi:hypothetical protein
MQQTKPQGGSERAAVRLRMWPRPRRCSRKGDRPELILADPTKLESIDVFESTFPVAMDLEAAIDAAEDAGPRFGDGLRYMLRSNRFELPSQLVFFNPSIPQRHPSCSFMG